MIKRKYNKHSIQEAIFETKFSNDNFDSTAPGQIFDYIKNNYPLKQDIQYLYIPNHTHQTPISLTRAYKEDRSELLQFGHGITIVNNLNYSGWEHFTPAIHQMLDAYTHVVTPESVERVGIRYINAFHIPEININITDYFNLGVQIPNQLANLKGLELTFVNETTNFNESTFTIKTKFFTDALKAGEIGNRFILDIDCYNSEISKTDVEEIKSLGTQAHDILENIFESIITEKMRSLMEIINE